jgi:hypothetical protein
MDQPNSPPLLGIQSPLLVQLFAAEGVLMGVQKGSFLFHKGGPPAAFMLESGSLVLIGPTINQVQLLPRFSTIGLVECLSMVPSPYTCFVSSAAHVRKLSAKEVTRHLATRPDLRNLCLQGLLSKGTFFE